MRRAAGVGVLLLACVLLLAGAVGARAPRRCARPHHRCYRPRHRHHRRVKPPVTVTTTTTATTSSVRTTTTTSSATTTSVPLPSRLEVDENDQGQPPDPPYSLQPSYTHVAAGTVQFNVYNYGMDPHTFAVVRGGTASGTPLAGVANIPAGGNTTVSVSGLAPGTYTLYCTLAGHAANGMRYTVTVG